VLKNEKLAVARSAVRVLPLTFHAGGVKAPPLEEEEEVPPDLRTL